MLPLILAVAGVYVLTAMKPTGKLKSTAPPPIQRSPVTIPKNTNVMTQTANQPWAQPVAQVKQTVGGVGAIASTSASVIHSLSDVWGSISGFGGTNGESETSDWDDEDYDDSESILPSPSEDQSQTVSEYYDENSDYQDYEYA